MYEWGQLKHSTIMRIFGIVLVDQISMVTEYFQLGPLNVYLKEKRDSITQTDLLEASANLASALWHLVMKFVLRNETRRRLIFVVLIFRMKKRWYMVKYVVGNCMFTSTIADVLLSSWLIPVCTALMIRLSKFLGFDKYIHNMFTYIFS